MCVAVGVMLLRQPACCLLLPTTPVPHPWLWAGLEIVQRAAWCREGSMGWWGKRVSCSDFRRSGSLLPAQPTEVQASSWVVGLGWEMTMILHPWSEESLTCCLAVGTSPLQTSAGSCPVLAVTLRAISPPLGRGNPSALAPPGPAVATGAGSKPSACAHRSRLLVDVKGPCETN